MNSWSSLENMVCVDYFVILPALGRVRVVWQTVRQVVVHSTVAHIVLDSMNFGHAQLTPHHHVHQETDLRGRQGHVNGLGHGKGFKGLTGDPRRV